MRIRFCFARQKQLAQISHLDMLRMFLRALNRSGLPMAYSQGFNPHPRFTLALPMPLGITAGEEYGELVFTEEVMPDQFITALGEQLPVGLVIKDADVVDSELPSLASLVSAALYRAVPKEDSIALVKTELIQASLDRLMAKEEIMMQRKTKKKKIAHTNIRPFIHEIKVDSNINEPLVLKLLLQAGSQGGVAPAFVIEQLELEPGSGRLHAYNWQIHRERLYLKENGNLRPLSEGM